MQAANHDTFDFAQFLVDCAAITSQQANEVRQRAEKERAPIGQLLMQYGHLSVKQIMAVLAAQADAPGERFGQIAIRLGFITVRTLEDTLELQRLRQQHAIEVVRKLELFEPLALIELIVAYVSRLERTLAAR